MSIIVAARKKNQLSIACDSQTNFGSIKVSSEHMINHSKIYKINDSYLGIIGWLAVSQIVEHLIINNPKIFKLNSRIEIFDTLLAIQKTLEDKYNIETKESKDQPVSSNRISVLIINKNGIFEADTYREVNEYMKFWAIGSGRRFALGAMHSLYEKDYSSEEIAKAGSN